MSDFPFSRQDEVFFPLTQFANRNIIVFTQASGVWTSHCTYMYHSYSSIPQNHTIYFLAPQLDCSLFSVSLNS